MGVGSTKRRAEGKSVAKCGGNMASLLKHKDTKAQRHEEELGEDRRYSLL
jgi:hypothetical protein